MQVTHDIYTLQPSGKLPSSTASELKNGFKGVIQQALQGAIGITRNSKREAVLLSAELYDQIVAELTARDPLEALRKDYDARFTAMQTDVSKVSYEDAFDASSEELGKAAVSQASAE